MGAVKGGKYQLFMFNVKYSHSLMTKLRQVNNIGIITSNVYKIQSIIIYFILPFAARYPYFRVDTHDLLPTSPTHH